VGVRAATLGAQRDGPAAFTLQLPVRAPLSMGLPTPPAGLSVVQSPVPTGPLPATMPAVAMPPQQQLQPAATAGAAMEPPPQAQQGAAQ